jgi:hypothetical protein
VAECIPQTALARRREPFRFVTTWQMNAVSGRSKFLAGVLAANLGVVTGPAGAQTNPISGPPITVYVQATDARFDAYLYVKKNISPDNKPSTSEEFFYIPPSISKERERELANWQRQFNSIVSAAIFSESVQSKISRIKEEFARADSASECWTVDYKRERRITITIIGSANETTMKNEYEAASRLFLSNPRNFTCKYTSPLRTELNEAQPEPH